MRLFQYFGVQKNLFLQYHYLSIVLVALPNHLNVCNRFGDLRHSEDKKLTEYVMLGTLTSFALTIAIGLLVSSLATQLPIGK